MLPNGDDNAPTRMTPRSVADEWFARESWSAVCTIGAIAGFLIPVATSIMVLAGLSLGNMMHRSLQTRELFPARQTNTVDAAPQRELHRVRAPEHRTWLVPPGLAAGVGVCFTFTGGILGIVRKYRCGGRSPFSFMHGLLCIEHERLALFGFFFGAAARLRLFVPAETPLRWLPLRLSDGGVPVWMAVVAWGITAGVSATFIHSWWRFHADSLVLRLPRP